MMYYVYNTRAQFSDALERWKRYLGNVCLPNGLDKSSHGIGTKNIGNPTLCKILLCGYD